MLTHISLFQHPLDELHALNSGTGKCSPLTSQLFRTWFVSVIIVISGFQMATTICEASGKQTVAFLRYFLKLFWVSAYLEAVSPSSTFTVILRI